MNVNSLSIASVLLCSFPTLTFADSIYQTQLKQFTEQREKALASAAQPINKKYQESLQDLLLRASRSNDTEAVAAIADALKALGTPDDTKKTPGLSPDAKRYAGRWTITFASGAVACQRTLNADGTVIPSPATSWEISDNKLKIHMDAGKIDTFDLPLRGDKLNGVSWDGIPIILKKAK